MISQGRYFETMQISCFSSNFCLLILAFINEYFLLITYLLLWYLLNNDLLFLSFFLHLEIRIFSSREELSLLHLFIYSIAYLIWTRRYLFYFMGHNTILSEFTLLLKWFHLWTLGTPFNWLSSFQYVPILFLSTFLVSGAIRFSRVILYLPCLSPGISYFFKELLG